MTTTTPPTAAQLNKFSARITQPASQGASQAMLIATGLSWDDLNMPGCVMAMGRLNRPSIMVYGGTIRAGCATIRGTEEKLDVVSAFQAYGQKLAGKLNENERKLLLSKACPGQGACGGMYTANTMSSFIECMGLSLPYSS